MKLIIQILICFVLLASTLTVLADETPYRVGVAIRDITGPAAEVNMMGYAMLGQRTHGLHLRLRARIFIIEDKKTKNRVVYVNNDLGMCMLAIKESLVDRLKSAGYTQYTRDNLIIAATHTHSGPGGFSWYTLYDITSLGFEKENFQFILDGIYDGIIEADKNLRDGRLKISSDLLFDSNINRSPTAYELNPSEEREYYKNEGNTEKRMTVLKIEGTNGEDIGVVSWFPVHCTSMNNTNELISGDNKGYASYVFEKFINPNKLPGENTFVAAFGQSNEGDVSPNTRGPKCLDGRECDLLHSTCHGNVKECIASGPGKDMFESTQIIGKKQFEKALDLYQHPKKEIEGGIEIRHTHINMSNLTVSANFTSTGKDEKTCRPALGFSFAAGTTDGPGEDFWKQGDNSTGNAFWRFVSSFLSKPTQEQIDCQHPKPILLDVGLASPSPWVPTTLPIQLTVIGKDLVICSLPSELSTMAGRRLKKRVKETLIKYGKATNDTEIVISGLTNGYSGYSVTYEEYQQQRYEGASTLYGPHTIAAYTQEMVKLAEAIGKGVPVDPGNTPDNLMSKTWSLRPGVVADAHPIGSYFGAVKTDAQDSYNRGQRVTVEFWGAHLNNQFTKIPSFLNIEQLQSDGSWKVVLTDGDWDTRVSWSRYLIAESIITTTWDIAPETQSGTYRFHHYGISKSIFGSFSSYEGVSKSFKVN